MAAIFKSKFRLIAMLDFLELKCKKRLIVFSSYLNLLGIFNSLEFLTKVSKSVLYTHFLK